MKSLYVVWSREQELACLLRTEMGLADSIQQQVGTSMMIL